MQVMTAELWYILVGQAAKEKNVDGSELVKLIRRKNPTFRASPEAPKPTRMGLVTEFRNRWRQHGRKGAFSIDLSSCFG